jgi:hypothetical protein
MASDLVKAGQGESKTTPLVLRAAYAAAILFRTWHVYLALRV